MLGIGGKGMRTRFSSMVVCLGVLLHLAVCGAAQETTGGLQGTVKDPSGAVVPNAKIVVTASTLVGEKSLETDGSGYYRFANLPPGTYTITVTGSGFDTAKRELVLAVGHLPTVDFVLEIGKASQVVEVNAATPVIDTTTNVTTTNVTEAVINSIPHGTSFQSVIQFAPAARNEPLMGTNTTVAQSSFGAASSNGNGAGQAGSMSNGGGQGFSVAGGSDSENSYLVEGQETANLIGGYSHTNVPFDFIQEVEIKNSGIQSEHGGALGGVVNVIMKKGSNHYHGSVFAQFENDAMDANQIPPVARYNPLSSQTPTSWGLLDPNSRNINRRRITPATSSPDSRSADRSCGTGFSSSWVQSRIENDERAVNYDQTGGLGAWCRQVRPKYANVLHDRASRCSDHPKTSRLRFLAVSTSEAVRREPADCRFDAGIFQRGFDDCTLDLRA